MDAAEVLVGEGGARATFELPMPVTSFPVGHAHMVLLAVKAVRVVPEGFAKTTENISRKI